ncbi:MAG: hypothetical protein MZV63_65265 [Marinilabiliales bacterium]|nr:hypothetical protein [Marinilabiliales bacterium]
MTSRTRCRDCRACPTTSSRPTGPIRTSTMAPTGSTSSWPRSNSRGASARSTSIPTSASACWATPWPSRPEWIMRSSSGRGSSSPWAWATRPSYWTSA